jgi:hypothetical protein
MDEILNGEMEADRREDAAFQQADKWQRCFLVWRQVFDAKKYCLLAFLVSLILVIQLLALFEPPDFLVKAASKRAAEVACHLFVDGSNETELGRRCLSLLSTSETPVEDE